MADDLVRVDACDEGVVRTYDVARRIVRTRTSRQFVEIDDVKNFGVSLYVDAWPQCSEFDTDRYHQALVHPGLIARTDPFDVLVLGGGDFGAASELIRYPNLTSVRIVDWDLELVELAKTHLHPIHQGAWRDPRVIVEGENPDAFEFLKVSSESYDIIFGDLTDLTAIGDAFNAIMIDLKRKLRPKGAFISQCAEYPSRPSQVPGFTDVVKKIGGHFEYHWVYKVYVASFGYEQSFLICSDSKNFDPLTLSYERLKALIGRLKGELTEYSPELHHSFFALSPGMSKGLMKG